MIAGRIKSKYIVQDIRFNGGYFLNEDAVNSRALEENSEQCSQLTELADVWNPPIFKRQFCQETERAIPYCQSSDVTNALEGSDVFINKIQATKVGSVVEENQILITGFGTIGNTRLVNELSSGISYANNVCRVKANEGVLHGYLYAVLTSKYGCSQLNKNASGSVVRYIEAPGIKKTLIPNLSDSKQEEIHNLIVEASNLRVEANKLLNEAQEIFISRIELKKKYQNTNTVNLSRLKSDLRFGGNFFLSIGDLYENQILESDFTYLSEYVSSIFTSGRDKRNYTKKENGLAFLSNGDISSFNPFNSCNYIVKKNVKDHSLIKDDMILTGRVGQDTVGKVYLPYQSIIDTVASDNIIRIKVSNLENICFLFAFLSSKIGNEIIRKRKTGVGQPFVTEEMFKNIPIPKVGKAEREMIDSNVNSYREKIDKSLSLEMTAIDLVEKEIESWQK